MRVMATMNITPPAAQYNDFLTRPKYRADIDGLRAIAILSVVAYHVFPKWVRGGFVGVDVFFVISGYLISSIILGSLDKGGFSFAAFYSRRIKRIFPALIVVLIGCFAFGWFVLLPGEYKQLGKHIAGGAGFVSNYILWNEAGYFDNAAETKPLLHLWSLGIEEQFYIVWPLLLYLAWKRRFNLFSLTIFIVIASFSFNVVKAHGDVVETFYSTATRVWELLIGSTLAYLALHEQAVSDPLAKSFTTLSQRKIICDVKSIVGFAFVAVALCAVNKEKSFPGWWALLPTVGAYLLISAGPEAWLNRKVLSHPVMVWFGLISFPLYLWHWPMLSFARIVESATPSLEIRIVAVLLSIVLAWLTYKLIEKPVRFGTHHKSTIAILCLLMLITGFLGYYSYKRDGLDFRFPEIIRGISNFRYNCEKEYRYRTCFLGKDQDKSAFINCVDQPPTPDSQSILLWGDSHAAHLYPGLKKVLGNEFKLIQFTASGCPPILGIDIENHPFCKDINSFVFDRILKERPSRIILAAAWSIYDMSALSCTIEQLRSAGVKRIDLIGPVPQWKDELSKILYNLVKQDTRHHRVPQRMRLGLIPNTEPIDESMHKLASRLNINYISARKILCNKEGCLTRVGETSDSLTAWDDVHLTTAGSAYLVSHFPQ